MGVKKRHGCPSPSPFLLVVGWQTLDALSLSLGRREVGKKNELNLAYGGGSHVQRDFPLSRHCVVISQLGRSL